MVNEDTEKGIKQIKALVPDILLHKPTDEDESDKSVKLTETQLVNNENQGSEDDFALPSHYDNNQSLPANLLMLSGLGDFPSVKSKLESFGNFILEKTKSEVSQVGKIFEDDGNDDDDSADQDTDDEMRKTKEEYAKLNLLDDEIDSKSESSNHTSESKKVRDSRSSLISYEDSNSITKAEKLLSSFSNSLDNNFDSLFEAEFARDSHDLNSIDRQKSSSISNKDLGLIEHIPADEDLTSFQKSVIEKLDVDNGRASLLMKIKNREPKKTREEAITESKRLSLLIADRIKAVFELSDDDCFEGNFSAWLLKDVLVQGHVYFTRDCMLFFAFLPQLKPDIPIQKGSLGMRVSSGESVIKAGAGLTKRYWGVLSPETLFIYLSTTDQYFPKIVVDLNTVDKVELLDKNYATKSRGDKTPTMSPSPLDGTRSPEEVSGVDGQLYEEDAKNNNGLWFKVVTPKKSYRFHTDNIHLARQWTSSISKLVFQLRNLNVKNEVLIKIPLKDVQDFRKTVMYEDLTNDETPALFSFLHTIEMGDSLKAKVKAKVKGNSTSDNGNDLNEDSLHLMLFHEVNKFDEIAKRNINYRSSDGSSITSSVSMNSRPRSRTISTLGSSNNSIVDAIISQAEVSEHNSPSAIKRIGSLISAPAKMVTARSLSYNSDTSPKSLDYYLTDPEKLKAYTNVSFQGLQKVGMAIQLELRAVDETISRYDSSDYSPFTPLQLSSPIEVEQESKKKMSAIKKIGKGIKNWANLSLLLQKKPDHYVETKRGDPLFVADDKEQKILEKHFQEHFSLKELTLIATYFCRIRRTGPLGGKLYLGDSHLCFRSLFPGNTFKMILPLSQIEEVKKGPNQKLAFSTLIVVIEGKDEIIFEFGSELHRTDCFELLEKQLKKNPEEIEERVEVPNMIHEDELEHVNNKDDSHSTESNALENARIKLFEDRINAAAGIPIPIILEDSPFHKTEVRPNSSYRVTLLTIGLRGDVQPYVALALGLKKEGHQVTIVSHIEFKDWVESFGIKYKVIAGDPTELMDLMVSHGGFLVSFLKDASSRFRTWIKELLWTSWEACKNSDILIESPSAMAGIHIAEALGIPYFRAFTMPWTKTRAYPHAFFVPGEKIGGSYNYISHVLFETVFWKGINRQVNKWRVNELGIPRTNLAKLQQGKIPFLYNISPSVFPPALDFPDWVKVTGYWFLDESSIKNRAYEPPKKLIEFMEKARRDKKKIVYIGFGSIVVQDAKKMTKSVIEGVLDADVRCILNKGWSDRLDKKDNQEGKSGKSNDSEGNESGSKDSTEEANSKKQNSGENEQVKEEDEEEEEEEEEDVYDEKKEDEEDEEEELPSCIYETDNIPHDWLFKNIDASVHHGGSGTTGASLRAGIPTIIKPFFGDQFFFATRIEDLGVGVSLKHMNQESLSKALTTVTTDIHIIEKAKKIGEHIRAEDGVTTAIECIYSELEYAGNVLHSRQSDYAKNYEVHTPMIRDDEDDDEDALSLNDDELDAIEVR